MCLQEETILFLHKPSILSPVFPDLIKLPFPNATQLNYT